MIYVGICCGDWLLINWAYQRPINQIQTIIKYLENLAQTFGVSDLILKYIQEKCVKIEEIQSW